MKATLLKYKIGLIILFVFSIVLVGVVLVQASSAKQDTNTNNAASNIADKLNTYVSSNDTVPTTLAAAGVKQVPSTISYQKLSNSSYKFCAIYKGNSSGFDASGVATNLLTGSSSSGPNIPADNSELIIDTIYHKGANCQTVNPTIYFPVDNNPCLSLQNAQCTSSGAVTSTATLCEYGMTSMNGCQMRCSLNTKTTAERIIDGTITAVNGANSSSRVLTVKDAKNALHQVSVTSSTTYHDSNCTALDPSNFATGDEVRVVVDAAIVYPGGVNDHVTATELDDLSY